jgi:hypothetical protein
MCFGYFDPTETISTTSQAQVAELYEQALSADAAMGFTSEPRLCWADSTEDLYRLGGEWLDAWQKLQAWAQTSVVTIGQSAYRGHAID